jgi:hypothetical protein
MWGTCVLPLVLSPCGAVVLIDSSGGVHDSVVSKGTLVCGTAVML